MYHSPKTTVCIVINIIEQTFFLQFTPYPCNFLSFFPNIITENISTCTSRKFFNLPKPVVNNNNDNIFIFLNMNTNITITF